MENAKNKLEEMFKKESNKGETIFVRCNKYDFEKIKEISKKHNVTRAEVIRHLVKFALEALKDTDDKD